METHNGVYEKPDKDRGAISPPETYDKDWEIKIANAKRAWKHGKKMHRGKPAKVKANLLRMS